jgi:hypothetical protein
MSIIIWSGLPRFRLFMAALLLAGCAAAPESPSTLPPPPVALPGSEADPLARLPASFASTPGCPHCLRVTLTLRPDGSYVVRERLMNSEFHDFGRWARGGDGTLRLTGERDAPRVYVTRPPDTLDSQDATQGGDLKRLPAVETLRGPFRMLGHFDGSRFRECRTGLSWPLGESRAGAELKQQLVDKSLDSAFVSIDGRFEEQAGAEKLLVLRLPSIVNHGRCPG